MLSKVTELIPGTDHWPQFVDNECRQFEARVSTVQIRDTNTRNPSVFLHGMNGRSLHIAVSHGEGRAKFAHSSDLQSLNEAQMVPIRYVDNYGKVAIRTSGPWPGTVYDDTQVWGATGVYEQSGSFRVGMMSISTRP